MQVKADVLAKRIETLQGEAAAVDELRDELAAAQKEEEHYKEAIAHLEADLHALEQRTNTARKKYVFFFFFFLSFPRVLSYLS